jgi:AhpC/TSA antioxidant enzyme
LPSVHLPTLPTPRPLTHTLALSPTSYTDNTNTKLVVVGLSPPSLIPDFRAATGYQGELLVDPEQRAYRALDLVRSKGVSDLAAGPDAGYASGFLTGMWYSVRTMMGAKESTGDVYQQGGSFVLGPGERCVFAHRELGSKDNAPFDAVLQAVLDDHNGLF